VFIVPRIVPLEYVSTTLGLHKSVCILSATCVIVLRSCLQLENTGTTIAQTLSGLWLDSKKKGGNPARTLTTLSENEPRLQWLLNGFLFVNILHLVAIFGLGYLNERRQNPWKDEAIQNEAVENEERQGASASGSSSGNEGTSSPLDFPLRIPSDRTPDGDHTISPILHPRDASSLHQGDETLLRPNKSRQGTTMLGATTPAEVRRGKFFVTLCIGTVIFTWLLFFVTSFLKIKSRREREGDP
jgi:hypothetical protein